MNMNITTLTTLLILFACAFTNIACTAAQEPTATAVVETTPVHGDGDAGDDLCIWLHPTDPSLSTVIGTDSKFGVAVYDLTGKELFYHADGAKGMVDVRYNFPLAGQRVAIVAAGDKVSNSITLYTVNPETRDLVDVSAREIEPGLMIYGTCMYRSATTGDYYAIVTSQKGEVEQWRIFDNGTGKVDAELARRFTLNPEGPGPDYKIEGCVADDELARLYLAQEIAGCIWRVGAEPSESVEKPFLVDQSKANGGHTVADVEGLTVYYKRDGTGYLLASNQGNYTYTVYAREGDNKYLMTFKVSGSDSVDAATSDDSIDVVPIHLNDTFSKGLLVVEDGKNTNGGKAAHDNYKLVPWEAVAAIGSPALDVDTAWDPRKVGAKEDSTSETPEQEGR